MAQYVNRLSIRPGYSHTLYNMDVKLIDRGVTVNQRSQLATGTASLAVEYKLGRFNLTYTFGYLQPVNSTVTSTYAAADDVNSEQRLSGFSNAAGLSVYPFRNANRFRPYLYAGLTHHQLTLRRDAITHVNLVPPQNNDELPTKVSFEHPAYHGSVGGAGAELGLGVKYLEGERFGFSLGVVAGGIYQGHTAYIPALIYTSRAEIGLVFRTFKTKMPL